MMDFKLTDGNSPTVFSTDGYILMIMPMLAADKPKGEAKPQAKTEAEVAQVVSRSRSRCCGSGSARQKSQ